MGSSRLCIGFFLWESTNEWQRRWKWKGHNFPLLSFFSHSGGGHLNGAIGTDKRQGGLGRRPKCPRLLDLRGGGGGGTYGRMDGWLDGGVLTRVRRSLSLQWHKKRPIGRCTLGPLWYSLFSIIDIFSRHDKILLQMVEDGRVGVEPQLLRTDGNIWK